MKYLRLTIAALVLLTLSVPIPASSAVVQCDNSTPVDQNNKKATPPVEIMKLFPKSIVVETNCGSIEIELLSKEAPITNTVILSLFRENYYVDTACHRLTTKDIFVVQCGDPTGTGSGDLGFRYRDENLPTAGANSYPKGTVAMANTGRDTNGSQFFITHRDTTLGPNYTIWGRVTSGMEILDFIASKGVVGGGSDGKLNQNLIIKSFTEKYEPWFQAMIDKQVDSKYAAVLNKAESSAKDAIAAQVAAEARFAALQNDFNVLKQERDGLFSDVTVLRRDVDSLRSQLAENTDALKSIISTNAKLSSSLKKICKVKPKPKGC